MDPDKLYKRVLAAGICLCSYSMSTPTKDADEVYQRAALILCFATLCIFLRRRVGLPKPPD